MADNAQGGALARTHEGRPGLPRGRSHLPAPAVRAAQRRRLLRAVIAAVAESGYHAVTVSGIVRRARVSRAAFYEHFDDRDDCFLTATAEGWQLLTGQVAAAARAIPDDAPAEDTLRAGLRAFLRFLAAEPAFARVFYIDMPSAGPLAAGRVQAAAEQYAGINRRWHERARTRNPGWPRVPDEAYTALAGGLIQLVRSYVRTGRTGDLPGLEDTLVSLHLAVLAARPWDADQRSQAGKGRKSKTATRRSRRA
ncbi:MAG TPA: helix-turn-helix domain-containing protein [Trebonia sp.]